MLQAREAAGFVLLVSQRIFSIGVEQVHRVVRMTEVYTYTKIRFKCPPLQTKGNISTSDDLTSDLSPEDYLGEAAANSVALVVER